MKRHGVLLLIFMFIASLAQADTAPLRDEFTYPLPAGSVNGTVGESGAVRTVVDTYAATELCTNGGFETVGAGPPACQNWNDEVRTGAIARTTTAGEFRSGTAALKLTKGATGDTDVYHDNVTLIAGLSYQLTFWTRGDGTNAGAYSVYNNASSSYIIAKTTTGVTGTTYQQVTATFTAPTGVTTILLFLYAPPATGGIAYFDDVSLLPAQGLVSIADGKLSISGGKAIYGDPCLYYAALGVRTAGKIGVCEVTPSSANGYLAFGFPGNLASVDTDVIRLRASAGVSVHDAIDVGPIVATYSANTSYRLAVVLRSVGSFFYIKGGAFVNWTLLFIGSKSSSTVLYPALGNYSQTYTSDFFRIPQTLWLPSPLTSDGFSLATTSDGLGHAEGVAGGLGSGGAGRAWTGATWGVAGGVLSNTPTLGEELATGTLTIGSWYSITATEVDHFYLGCAIGNTFRATAETSLDASNKVKLITLSSLFCTTLESTPNVLARAALTLTAGTQAGLVVRLDDPSNPQNFVIAYHDGMNVKLDSCIGGTYVNRISAAATYVASAPLVVVADGTNYDVYYNHTKVGSTSTFSDAALDNNLYHGTFSTYSGNTVDNYRCDARGNEGQWNILDALSVMPQQPKPRIMSK